ncbi:MAG: T9SS type A sorting domain-containing protein, partial [Bacteroidales bacterium]|nr:T9SS type A sorting domain-containing protein [Bacteroidales bacterium]
GQGFLINAGGSGGNIQFTKAMQTHDTGLSLKSASTSWPGVTLLAETGNQSRYTIIAFNENMTTGLDKTYDAGLLASSDFILYSHLVSGDEGVDFEIQCLPDNMYSELSVPIGIDLPKAGKVTFKAAGVILPNGLYPVLEDRLLKTSAPLKTESDSYTVDFDGSTQGIGRFYLTFTNITSAEAVTQPESFKAWFARGKIVLEGYAEEGTRVSLYDMSGRKLAVHRLQSINRNEIPAPALSPGIYLLRIEGRKQRHEIKIPVVY